MKHEVTGTVTFRYKVKYSWTFIIQDRCCSTQHHEICICVLQWGTWGLLCRWPVWAVSQMCDWCIKNQPLQTNMQCSNL